MIRRLLNGFRRPPAPPVAPAPAPERRTFAVSQSAVERSRATSRPVAEPFKLPQHPPASVPSGRTMAMDDGTVAPMTWAASIIAGALEEGQTFLGYPHLAELAQRPEYRRIVEVIARHMTRKWIKLTAKGDEDKSEKLDRIEAAMKRLRVQDVFREAAEQDGYFGRGHIFLDFGAADPAELRMPVGDGRDAVSRNKVGRGSLKRLQSVEAVWCYPTNYNSNDPLRPDWYKPSSWFVMNREVHASRFLTVIGREVPDLLKPAYSFGGLAMTQMAKPYVDNWLRVRQGTTEIVEAFSVFVLKTDMAQAVQDNAEGLFRRAELFNNLRNNRGLLMVDKNGEDFANVAAPLSGLEALQAQAQEHMAAVCGIPLVELLGIQPAGLNASSDGELQVFDTMIHCAQEMLFRAPLQSVLGFIQLSEFGEVDPDIDFVFEPLRPMSEKEVADKRLVEAQTDQIYLQEGIISAQESRKRLADDPESPYPGLDADDVPLPPPGEIEGFGAPPPGGVMPAGDDDAPTVPQEMPAQDAEFHESDHPRAPDGKFGSGGGAGGGSGHEALASKQIAWTKNQKTNAGLAASALKEAGFHAMTENPSGRKTDKRFAAIGSPTNGILVNPASPFWKDPVASAKANYEAGHLSTEHPMGVLLHEIAHVKHDAPRNWMTDSQKAIASEVSKYAATNPSEFVAETFAGLHTGKKYSDQVMNLYRNYARER